MTIQTIREIAEINSFEIKQNKEIAPKDIFLFEKKALQNSQRGIVPFDDLKAIDLDFLKMRDQSGYPRFAVFSLDQPDCSISSTANIEGGYEYIYDCTWKSKYVTSKFIDVFEKLVNEAKLSLMYSSYTFSRARKKVTISKIFSGIIPEKTRQKIKKYSRSIENKNYEILIIAEAYDWKREITIVDLDPIVVLIKDEFAYLLDVFDLSPLENYVTSEFC